MDEKSKIITPFATQNILTRGVPKTQQTISYAAGDDGEYEAGWWIGRLNSNNRTRFIAKTISGDDIVFDRATGLMWAADGNAAGCNNGNPITWANAIAYADGAGSLTFAGFSDWYIPNIRQLNSLINYAIVAGAVIDEPPFSNTISDIYWSATSHCIFTTEAHGIDFGTSSRYWYLKTGLNYIRCVRGGI